MKGIILGEVTQEYMNLISKDDSFTFLNMRAIVEEGAKHERTFLHRDYTLS